jgi:hypothetical protein
MYVVDIGDGPIPALHRLAEGDDGGENEYEWIVVGQAMPLPTEAVHVWVGPIRLKMRED